jgi:divalent metal cation (Fe/Co/Zn/Cd) transporter
LWAILAVAFGLLSVFAIAVPWARPALKIAVANMVLTAAMAVMNSILLDRLREK